MGQDKEKHNLKHEKESRYEHIVADLSKYQNKAGHYLDEGQSEELNGVIVVEVCMNEAFEEWPESIEISHQPEGSWYSIEVGQKVLDQLPIEIG